MIRDNLITRFRTRVPIATKAILLTLLVITGYVWMFRPDILPLRKSSIAEVGGVLGMVVLVLGYLGQALISLHPSTKASTMRSKGWEQLVIGLWAFLHPTILIATQIRGEGDLLTVAVLPLAMFSGVAVVNGIGMLITGKEGERQS